MRIGVDATCWANARGYGRFARELTFAMASAAPSDEFVCLADRQAIAAWPHQLANVHLVEVAQDESPTVAASADGSRSPLDMLRLTRAVWRAAPAVFFSPSVYTYFPLPPGQRAVVTVHDTIAEEHPGLTLPTARARLFWRLKVGLAIRQATLVLTVSEYSARSIARVLGVPPRRIRVAVEAPAAAFHEASRAEIEVAARRVGLPAGAEWFVYVGGFNPHKRIDVIIDALAAVSRARARQPYLLLVGALQGDVFHREVDGLRRRIAAAGLEGQVIWPGFVPDDELRGLLAGATGSLLPSEIEGFGLPAVEAAACGTPVIATTESPLPELLEGGGRFVRPGDVDALAGAMRQFLDDAPARAEFARVALERASSLTWASCASNALAALREAAA